MQIEPASGSYSEALPLRASASEPGGEEGSLVDHAGIHLDQGGPRIELPARTGRVGDPACGDDGQPAAGDTRDVGNDLGAATKQRRSAQAARLAHVGKDSG